MKNYDEIYCMFHGTVSTSWRATDAVDDGLPYRNRRRWSVEEDMTIHRLAGKETWTNIGAKLRRTGPTAARRYMEIKAKGTPMYGSHLEAKGKR